jgi:hypothetical protein
MGEAKQIVVRPIAASDANRIIKALHYSGAVVHNSQVHLGVFMGDQCGGAMQFGPSMDKRKLLQLVSGTLWNEFIELNRMAFADWLPRNGESRCLGFAMRWLRKTYPQLKWVVSFADGAQCGDGTIYRASGFVLTGIRKNNSLWQGPVVGGEPGEVISRTTVPKGRHIISNITVHKGKHAIARGGGASMKDYKAEGYEPIPGFQLRYVYFIDSTARERLTVPVLPFSEIDRVGAGMYRGQRKTRAESIGSDAPGVQPGEGGAAPTSALSADIPKETP